MSIFKNFNPQKTLTAMQTQLRTDITIADISKIIAYYQYTPGLSCGTHQYCGRPHTGSLDSPPAPAIPSAPETDRF